MTVEQVVDRLGFKKHDFKTADHKVFNHELTDSDEFSHNFNVLDNDEEFTEDLDSQDINLFTNTIVFIDDDGEVEVKLTADFEKDVYNLTITEV